MGIHNPVCRISWIGLGNLQVGPTKQYEERDVFMVLGLAIVNDRTCSSDVDGLHDCLTGLRSEPLRSAAMEDEQKRQRVRYFVGI
jgi:hypothetical protein